MKMAAITRNMIQTVGRWALPGLVLAACSGSVFAQVESLCAEVQMQIIQEAALERQAFDAQMEIRNGLSGVTMTNVNIDIEILDEDGNIVVFTDNPSNTNALFFLTVSSLENIADIDGSGQVAGDTTVQVNWLIIPSPGAAGGSPVGKRYYIGANLTYRLNGNDQTMDVNPDSIFVQPQPELTLDYFLPGDVFANDPFTVEEEPVVPFSLGVRVQNNGFGIARNLTIDSGQPQIIENELGLLIEFNIIGSEVNGGIAPGSFRVNFGDVEGQSAGVARWLMTTSLSGVFTNFDAEFSHRDDFGGELTSLIDAVNTHTLVHDVRVDLPGRDGVRDFLADDSGVLQVYESDNVETPVNDQSPGSSLLVTGVNGTKTTYLLSAPMTASPLYVKLPFTNGEAASVVSVIRSDGKTISPDNAWLSKSRSSPTNEFVQFLNLFDVNVGGNYTIVIDDAENANLPPVLAAIGDQFTRIADPPLMFQVVASDPNGTIPLITVIPLPPGASLTEASSNGLGVADFNMTPPTNAAGVYPVRFVASDGILETSEVVKIYVGESGEGFDTNGIPNSLTNWAPTITDVLASSAIGLSTVVWDSVSNIQYDVYYSDQQVSTAMTWTLIQGGIEALSNETRLADNTLGINRTSRFYQVRLTGDPTSLDELWGVIRSRVQASTYSLLSAPLRMDRRMDGKLGEALAAVLQGDNGGAGDQLGDEVIFLDGPATIRSLYLDNSGQWRESGGALSTYEFAAGQGFFIERNTNTEARVTFTGKVGNDGSQTNTVVPGWNLLGLSEGKILDPKTVLAAGSNGGPVAAAAEELADLLVLLNPDGSWTRYMSVDGWGLPYDGEWINLETGEVLDVLLEPGQAYYYFRQSVPGSMEVPF